MVCLFNRLIVPALFLALMVSPTWQPWMDFPVGHALADDDDDDDSDDDDEDDDDSVGPSSGSDASPGSSSNFSSPGGATRPISGGSTLLDFLAPLLPGQPAPRAPARQVAPVVSLPDNAPDEIVALGLTADDLSVLLEEGFEVISERPLTGFELTTWRLRVPNGLALSDARTRVRSLPSGQDADFNHFYRSNQGPACDGPHCNAWQLVSWTGSASCGAGIRLGMVDTHLNEEHQTFANAALSVERVADDALDRSGAVHGTAVAALLVGDRESRSPGLLPEAELVAVDVFAREGSDERADVASLVGGLAYLAGQDVAVINLSLAGPSNAVLESLIRRMVSERNTIMIAAVGNAGPRSEPLYPAAYEDVIAVTAVGLDSRVYRRAVQGTHIDLAAPGVDVWSAASVSGARWHTGTSFAAPFVTAAAATLLQAQPDLTPTEVLQALVGEASDLGEPGRDNVYGHGLIATPHDCAPVAAAAEP